MNNLYETNLLPIEDYETLEECQECEGVYNNGDYIIDSFYNGNWTHGVQLMLDECIYPREFAQFVDEKEEEFGESIHSFLDREAFISITELWYELRNKQ